MLPSSSTEKNSLTVCTLCRSLFEDVVVVKSWENEEEEPVGLRPRQQTVRIHRYHVTWHPDARSLSDSIHSGCELCSNVWDELNARGLVGQREPTELLLRQAKFTVDLVERVPNDTNHEEIKWSLEMVVNDAISNRKTLVGVHHFRASERPAPDQSLPPLENRTNDPEPSTRDLSLAKQWLSQCRSNHERCQPIVDKEFEWPTRLIELWKDGNTTKARLVERDEISAMVPYVTLSHRWGAGAMYTLENDRLSQFKEQIDVEQLAQTFRDAFDVVLQMGLSYIWIDSLCIIQNSKADWKAECQKMAGVYANAALTIAATASTSSETGLFVKKRAKNPAILRVFVDIKRADARHGNRPEGIRGYYYLVHEHAWSVRVDYAPLNQRGWVLQERFFSARILHFGKDQLLWECQELQAAESISSLDAWPLRSNIREGYRSYRSLLPELNQSLANASSTSLQEHERAHGQNVKKAWDRIVEAYTQAQLTYSSDKLAAIAGITARFEVLLNDKSHRGLWRKDLFDDLLWYRTVGDSPRPAIKRAPSYTWACLDCPVAYERLTNDDELLVPCARIVGFEPHHRHINLVARLPRVRLKKSPRTMSRFSMDLTVNENVYRAQAQFDAQATDLAETYLSRKGVRVYLLCMYALQYELPIPSGGHVMRGESYGLLLKKEDIPGQYSRVGRFAADGDVWNEFHPRDDAPDGYYTITLI
ncbi:heterokaryon incompatibility protein-domain-containing protein [Boeremia exigua]|uniref:heterokaryon incompatibility protein-domain-containing protein n=1 Tax=Boeremia exigua TaxID=749465 RepID=UPI001E8CE6CB|nr:heterokaryon incompatibility protein-domain-containing protein [Boeremia exigua]KAH6616574.1 heterokaryon incompatibility protein-domain-containing protein [Boeremia exigua]